MVEPQAIVDREYGEQLPFVLHVHALDGLRIAGIVHDAQWDIRSLQPRSTVNRQDVRQRVAGQAIYLCINAGADRMAVGEQVGAIALESKRNIFLVGRLGDAVKEQVAELRVGSKTQAGVTPMREVCRLRFPSECCQLKVAKWVSSRWFSSRSLLRKSATPLTVSPGPISAALTPLRWVSESDRPSCRR